MGEFEPSPKGSPSPKPEKVLRGWIRRVLRPKSISGNESPPSTGDEPPFQAVPAFTVDPLPTGDIAPEATPIDTSLSIPAIQPPSTFDRSVANTIRYEDRILIELGNGHFNFYDADHNEMFPQVPLSVPHDVDNIMTMQQRADEINESLRQKGQAQKTEFKVHELASRRVKEFTLEDTGFRIGEHLPDEVLKARMHDGHLLLQFGDIALASAHNLEARGDNTAGKTDTEAEAKISREQLEEKIDRNKVNLTLFDHAVISINTGAAREQFYLPLDLETDPDSILLARVVDSIHKINRGYERAAGKKSIDYLPRTFRDIANVAWRLMPVAERRLFTVDEGVLKENGTQFIAKRVATILRTRTSRLYLTHERVEDQFSLLLPTKSFSIRYHEDPPADEDRDTYKLVSAGHGPVQPNQMKQAERQQLMEYAQLCVDVMRDPNLLTDTVAIAMLDLVMRRKGRWALRQLPESERVGSGQVHSFLQEQLAGRDIYNIAFAARTYGGGRQAPSGGLRGFEQVRNRPRPGTTNKGVDRRKDSIAREDAVARPEPKKPPTDDDLKA